MILIDDSNFLRDSYHVDGIYHCENYEGCKNIKNILFNGRVVEFTHCFDINKGVLIKHKTDAAGKIVIAKERVVYEILFGKVEVVLNGT